MKQLVFHGRKIGDCGQVKKPLQTGGKLAIFREKERKMSENNSKTAEIAPINIGVDVGRTLKRPSQAKLTPAKRKKFLEVFAKSFNVTRAAQAIGIHRTAVYQLIDSDEVFARAFQAVKDAYLDSVEETSITIALQPDARSYNDRRLMLEAHRKEIYGKNAEIAIAIQVNSLQASGELANFVHRLPSEK